MNNMLCSATRDKTIFCAAKARHRSSTICRMRRTENDGARFERFADELISLKFSSPAFSIYFSSSAGGALRCSSARNSCTSSVTRPSGYFAHTRTGPIPSYIIRTRGGHGCFARYRSLLSVDCRCASIRQLKIFINTIALKLFQKSL